MRLKTRAVWAVIYYNTYMQVAALLVYYHTSAHEREEILSQLDKSGIQKIFAVDNTETNRGYAEGINMLLNQHIDQADVFLIANIDITLPQRVQNNGVSYLLEAGKSFDIWGFPFVQKGVTYSGGRIDPVRMSGGLQSVDPLVSVGKPYQSVDFVSGSLMLIKRKVFDKIGYFNEDYGMYYEDVEFCYRAKLHDLRVGIDTNLIYEHHESSDDNPDKRRYLARNRLRFLLTYGSPWQKAYEVLRLPKTLYEEGRYLL